MPAPNFRAHAISRSVAVHVVMILDDFPRRVAPKNPFRLAMRPYDLDCPLGRLGLDQGEHAAAVVADLVDARTVRHCIASFLRDERHPPPGAESTSDVCDVDGVRKKPAAGSRSASGRSLRRNKDGETRIRVGPYAGHLGTPPMASISGIRIPQDRRVMEALIGEKLGKF